MSFLIPDNFIIYLGIFNVLLFLLACIPLFKSDKSTFQKTFLTIIAFCFPIVGSVIVIILNIFQRNKLSNS